MNITSDPEFANPWPYHTGDGERLYAIGDVHGELASLNRLLALINADLDERPTENFRLIFLGDLVDRGEKSRGVIDLVMTLVQAGSTIVLRGNHEEMLLSALSDSQEMLAWRQYGGLETLMSFGIPPSQLMAGQNIENVQAKFRQACGDDRINFIQNLPLSFRSGDYFFCHAGIRPGVPLSAQDARDLLWIREQFLASADPHEKYIVHGHSPVERIDIRPNRMNIDTGAYLTGRLSCVILEDNKLDGFDSKTTPNTRISYR